MENSGDSVREMSEKCVDSVREIWGESEGNVGRLEDMGKVSQRGIGSVFKMDERRL